MYDHFQSVNEIQNALKSMLWETLPYYNGSTENNIEVTIILLSNVYVWRNSKCREKEREEEKKVENSHDRLHLLNDIH